MRFLILAHQEDYTAKRVFLDLRRRHKTSHVRLVMCAEVTLAPRWQQNLDARGVTLETLELHDGTCIRGQQVGVVFNRLRYASVPQFANAQGDDRRYAESEAHAFLLSWLRGLPCPVINRPHPIGLGAHDKSWPLWLHLARKAGLPAREYQLTTNARRYPSKELKARRGWAGATRVIPLAEEELMVPTPGRCPTFYLEPGVQDSSVLIAGDEAVGDLAARFSLPLQNFRLATDCELLQVHFILTGSGWKVTGASAFPEVGNPAMVSAIVSMLERRSEVSEIA